MCVDVPQYQTRNTVQTIICHSKTFPRYCFENWLSIVLHSHRRAINHIHKLLKIVRHMGINLVPWIESSRTRTHTFFYRTRTHTHAKWSSRTQVSCTHLNHVNYIYWVEKKIPQATSLKQYVWLILFIIVTSMIHFTLYMIQVNTAYPALLGLFVTVNIRA